MTSPRRLVVFRFDRDPLTCRSRVALMRALNPGVPVHGLYGAGPGWRARVISVAGRRALGLDGLYVCPQPGRWNWRHGDLALVRWFREVGHRLAFDVLHFVEWDLVLTAPLSEVYASVPDEAVGLTCLTPTDQLAGRWSWLEGKAGEEYATLRRHASKAWGTTVSSLASLGVGPCFPRAFLEQYAVLDVPELCHDELRLPLAAECLGFELVDTSFRDGWWNAEEDSTFNVGGPAVSADTVRTETRRPGGRRVFHPVRDPLTLSKLGW